MLRILTLLISGLLLSPDTLAVCTLASGTPTRLTIDAKTIIISADAPVSTSTPIAQYDSPTVGGAGVVYDNCLAGTEYGKRSVSLSGQDSSTKIYATNIRGIGIKMLASNGSAFGNFPSTSHLVFANGSSVGSLTIPSGSFYRIEFYKLSNDLQLNNPLTGDTILPAGQIAYNYILSADPGSYTHSLDIGEMKIISTPACTVFHPNVNVNFDDVTPTLLEKGVSRELDFSINCKSDYGSYSASASMTTDTPTADGNFIRVRDFDGNMDRMKIRITDGEKNVMKVDGSTSESLKAITNQAAAFSWNATLLKGDSTAPAGGTFTAKAEIIFDIK